MVLPVLLLPGLFRRTDQRLSALDFYTRCFKLILGGESVRH